MEYIETSTFDTSEKDKIQEKVKNRKINEKVDNIIKSKVKANPLKALSSIKNKAPPEPTPEQIANRIKVEQTINKFQKEEIEECANSNEGLRIKSGVYSAMALPYYNNIVKKKLLENGLRNNKVINEVLDEQVVFRCNRLLEPKIRFFLHYGLEIFNVENQYKEAQQIDQLNSQHIQPMTQTTPKPHEEKPINDIEILDDDNN